MGMREGHSGNAPQTKRKIYCLPRALVLRAALEKKLLAGLNVAQRNQRVQAHLSAARPCLAEVDQFDVVIDTCTNNTQHI